MDLFYSFFHQHLIFPRQNTRFHLLRCLNRSLEFELHKTNKQKPKYNQNKKQTNKKTHPHPLALDWCFTHCRTASPVEKFEAVKKQTRCMFHQTGILLLQQHTAAISWEIKGQNHLLWQQTSTADRSAPEHPSCKPSLKFYYWSVILIKKEQLQEPILGLLSKHPSSQPSNTFSSKCLSTFSLISHHTCTARH